MTFIGTTDAYVVDYAHIVRGIGPPTKTWVPYDRTADLTKEGALKIVESNPSRMRAVHEKVTRTLIEPDPVYGKDNPHPCHQ